MSQVDRLPSPVDRDLLSRRIASRLDRIESLPRLREVLGRFPQADFFLYGGAVRDVALGRRSEGPFDLDMIAYIPSLDELIAEVEGDGRVEIGQLFHNLRWTPAGPGVTTYDFQALAKYNLKNPCRGISDVLRQVDFTGNSIAYNLRTGDIVDPNDGLGDLNRRIMRAVRFELENVTIPGLDVPLPATVWFRILHFASLLDLSIEPRTARWLAEHGDYLRLEPNFRKQFFAPRLSLLDGLS